MWLLYQSILKLTEENKITINGNLKEQLRAEATKRRACSNSKIVTPSLCKAAKKLKENNSIIIRKADKSSTFVIMNKEEYKEKLDQILLDHTKFKKITKDPTEDLKRKVNKLVKENNKKNADLKLPEIVGQHSPGYMYGNVKTHKPGNNLRPIIS